MEAIQKKFKERGFAIIEDIFSPIEVTDINQILEKESGFGVREVLLKYPELLDLIFNAKFKQLLHDISPTCDTIVKSIWFDKPPTANWVVNWHQDITINLTHIAEVDGFKNWRTNTKRTVVQPTRNILENIFTLRIHLDNCNAENGALHVIENSHQQGVINIKNWTANKTGKEYICEVAAGGVVLMHPLTLHSSKRTRNTHRRRVLHIEFSTAVLPNNLEWKEAISIHQQT